MSESKHTPGPWQVSLDRPSVILAAQPHNPDFVDTSEPETIASYGGILVAETVAPQNAHLIAAAPDLLEALKDCRLLIESVIDLNSLKPNGTFQTAHNQAIAAIDKALGKEGA